MEYNKIFKQEMITETMSLNELDIKPVFYIEAKNLFCLKRSFIFYDTHFEYKGLFGKKKKIIYSDIRNIYFSRNTIFIFLYSKKLPVIIFGIKKPAELSEKLKKLTGVIELQK